MSPPDSFRLTGLAGDTELGAGYHGRMLTGLPSVCKGRSGLARSGGHPNALCLSVFIRVQKSA